MLGLFVFPMGSNNKTLPSNSQVPPHNSNASFSVEFDLHMQSQQDGPHRVDPWPP